MKYLNSKIYKIVDNTNGNIYIGSTCYNLEQRLRNHVSKYKTYKKKENKDCSSYDIIKNNDYKIELLEIFPCKTKQELLIKEREYIENNKCINIKKPITSYQEKLDMDKEYYEKNKEKIAEKGKEYREKNRDIIAEKKKNWANSNKEKVAERHKRWYEDNKQNILEKSKEYREKNREKIAEWSKNHYEANKDKISEKIQCDICNKTIRRYCLTRHKKTPKCLNYKKD